jgi:hypothetical protein
MNASIRARFLSISHAGTITANDLAILFVHAVQQQDGLPDLAPEPIWGGHAP